MVCTVHNLKLNKTRLNVDKRKIILLIRSVFLLYIFWYNVTTDMQMPVGKSIGANSVLQTNETSFFLVFCSTYTIKKKPLFFTWDMVTFCDSITYCRIPLIGKMIFQRS